MRVGLSPTYLCLACLWQVSHSLPGPVGFSLWNDIRLPLLCQFACISLQRSTKLRVWLQIRRRRIVIPAHAGIHTPAYFRRGGPHAKGASMTFAGETGLGELSASGGCTSLGMSGSFDCTRFFDSYYPSHVFPPHPSLLPPVEKGQCPLALDGSEMRRGVRGLG